MTHHNRDEAYLAFCDYISRDYLSFVHYQMRPVLGSLAAAMRLHLLQQRWAWWTL